MARVKKSIPKDVQKCRQRTDGMSSIEENLDLGQGVSVTTMNAVIKKVTDKISLYNTRLSELDQIDNEIAVDLREMNNLSSRALKGAEFTYGRDSSEYEMMGGKRASERRRPPKKPKETP